MTDESHLKAEKRRQKNLKLFFCLPFSVYTIVLLATSDLPSTSSWTAIYPAILTVSQDRVSFQISVPRGQGRDGNGG